MARVSYVTCPECKKEFYINPEDYNRYKEAYAQCPFCLKEFDPEEGNPYPPLNR